jgi:hypothetical protein
LEFDMIMKASYILLSGASLLLLLLAAPRGWLLTSSPDRGKVQRQASSVAPTGNGTVRGGPHFVFLGGGYQGGK